MMKMHKKSKIWHKKGTRRYEIDRLGKVACCMVVLILLI